MALTPLSIGAIHSTQDALGRDTIRSLAPANANPTDLARQCNILTRMVITLAEIMILVQNCGHQEKMAALLYVQAKTTGAILRPRAGKRKEATRKSKPVRANDGSLSKRILPRSACTPTQDRNSPGGLIRSKRR
jgi:hypothetical protein